MECKNCYAGIEGEKEGWVHQATDVFSYCQHHGFDTCQWKYTNEEKDRKVFGENVKEN